MERSFNEVYWKLLEVLPESLKEKLEFKISFWAPEALWPNLTSFICDNVVLSSKNPLSVKIYSILYGCTEEEITARFKID